ncbi:MAG TPA: hypothetical protein O0X74_04455 [Methanocorpusculum sp.]|nr:hypothetical protein [Methanocorpusculum sp.]
MGVNDTKMAIQAPCAIAVFDKKKKKEVIVFPSVDCGYNCETCGWNPCEKERRLRDGVWQPVHMRINPETGKRVPLENVEQLCFHYT